MQEADDELRRASDELAMIVGDMKSKQGDLSPTAIGLRGNRDRESAKYAMFLKDRIKALKARRAELKAQEQSTRETELARQLFRQGVK